MRWALAMVSLLLLTVLLTDSSLALAGSPKAAGEDPFPLRCVDFSGSWKSDIGERYTIQQRNCSWMRMLKFYGAEKDSLTIVPDNRVRPVPGRNAQIRHRWNSITNGTVLEATRTYVSSGNLITEITTFERANSELLLETTYREIRRLSGPGEVHHEYDQQVFRRAPVIPGQSG